MIFLCVFLSLSHQTLKDHQVFEFDVGDKVEVASSPQIGVHPGEAERGLFQFYTSLLSMRSLRVQGLSTHLPTYLPNYI